MAKPVGGFKLEAHYETKEMAVYALVIAKGGLKIKEAVEDPGEGNTNTPALEVGIAKLDKDGFPIVGPGQSSARFSGGIGHYVARACTLEQLADKLENVILVNSSGGRVVVDATGLKGKYDFRLSWSQMADLDGSADGPTLLNALEAQLGLRLEQRRGSVRVLIVDHSKGFRQRIIIGGDVATIARPSRRLPRNNNPAGLMLRRFEIGSTAALLMAPTFCDAPKVHFISGVHRSGSSPGPPADVLVGVLNGVRALTWRLRTSTPARSN